MFFFTADRERAKRTLNLCHIILNAIMNLTEAFASLAASNTKLAKVLTEVDGKVDSLVALVAQLQEQLANQTLTPEQQATVDGIATVAQELDDIVPDENPPA